jgi:3-deoxy-manno-octulosonate cytidylyltransferase (CMP-KDO synthetase)
MKSLNVMALIPARLAATRFPNKLLQPLGDKTVIRATYENTVATGLFSEVIVVTDHVSILDEILNHGGKAVMSRNAHESGTDRIAEAAVDLNADVFLNVQGDEPFVSKEPLRKLIETFHDENTRVASIMKTITDSDAVQNINIVKVVTDKNNNSLLFSRSPIPFHRDKSISVSYKEHIGVYAFRKEALLLFTKLEPTPLELAEKIECLRFLENGIPLRMVETDAAMIKIDVPEDLPKAVEFLHQQKLKQA